MGKYLNKLPLELRKIINQAGEVSRQTRMPAFLVGGCLRDLILGADNFDIDITVEGSGIIFAEKLAKKCKSGLIIHERFGTAVLNLTNGLKVDIATTRKETYPFSAALPVVSPGSLKEDLFRRDFTVNAMALSIIPGRAEELIDPFGGRRDLAAGKIRVLHDLSFKDDPTRVLRAIRFKERLNFKIEPKTLSLLKEAIGLGLLNKVNPHRMRDEIILMLKEQDPLKQIKRLEELGGLSVISEKIKPAKSTYALFKSIGKEVSWFVKNFPRRRQLDLWLIYFTALLARLSCAEIKKISLKLALRKGEEKRIINYCQSGNKLIRQLSRKNILPARIFYLLEPVSYETVILLLASSANPYLKKHIKEFLENYNGTRLNVSGNDLRDLGILPGPEYSKILTKILGAKLNGRAPNRRNELVLIKKLISKQHKK